MKDFVSRLGICSNCKYGNARYSFWVPYERYTKLTGEKYCEIRVSEMFYATFRVQKCGIKRNRNKGKIEGANHISNNKTISVEILLLGSFVLFVLLHKILT
jgi:hypothetical protein